MIITNTMLNVIQNSFIGFDKMDQYSAIRVIQSVVKLILSPLLILMGLSILGAVIGHVLGYVTACLLGITILYLKIL